MSSKVNKLIKLLKCNAVGASEEGQLILSWELPQLSISGFCRQHRSCSCPCGEMCSTEVFLLHVTPKIFIRWHRNEVFFFLPLILPATAS